MKHIINFFIGLVKFVIFVAIVAVLAVSGIKKVKEARAKDASTPKAVIYPIVASTISPKISNVKLTLPYLAEVDNDNDVQIASRVPARVEKIKKTGQSVKKGEVVVKLDTTSTKSAINEIKAQIRASKVTLANLRATHRRTLKLLSVQGASIEQSQRESSQIASIESKISALREKIISLRNSLTYAKIISPVNGVVSKSFVSEGAISSPGKPLLSIRSKNGFYLKVRVPTQTKIKGVILNHKFYSATPLNSTFHGLAEYKVYTNDNSLITGDRVQVDVVVFNQQATLLPFDAILNRNGKSFVLVVNGNRAKPQEVHVLKSAEQGVAISDNLEGKKIVVAKPDILLKLTSGYALKVEE